MGKLADSYKQSKDQGGPLVLKGMNIKGMQLGSPSGEAEMNFATVSASEQAKQQVKEKAYHDFYNEITMIGKPVADITYGELLKASNGNLDLANQFIKTRNAFLGTKSDLQHTQNAVVGMLKTFVDAASEIPSSSGILGKRVQGPKNKIMQEFGQLPQREAYYKVLNISGPLLRRAMGDVGNAGEKETRMALDALEGLAHPQIEVRERSVKLLNDLFTELIGKPVDLGGNKTATAKGNKTRALDIQIKKLEDELSLNTEP